MKLCSNPGVNHQHWATHIRHTPFCSCPTLPTTTPIQPRREAARAKHFPNHRKRNQRTTTMNVEQRRRAPCEASKIKMLPNRQHFVVKILFWPSYLASWSLFVPCSIPMQSRRGRVRLPVQRPRSASTRIQARAWSLWLPRPGHLVNSRATSPRRMCTIFAPTNCVVSYWSWWARCSPAWTCSSSCDPSHWGRTMNCGQAFWLHNRRSVSISCKFPTRCSMFSVPVAEASYFTPITVVHALNLIVLLLVWLHLIMEWLPPLIMYAFIFMTVTVYSLTLTLDQCIISFMSITYGVAIAAFAYFGIQVNVRNLYRIQYIYWHTNTAAVRSVVRWWRRINHSLWTKPRDQSASKSTTTIIKFLSTKKSENKLVKLKQKTRFTKTFKIVSWTWQLG